MHHQTATYRCLQIYEILDIIFEAVLVRTKSGNKVTLDKHSLSSVLQTCRSFSVPAARLLWRDLYTLAPLILTMPEDLLDIEGSDNTRHSYQFTPRTIAFKREVVPSDWKRFDVYAPLVRHLGDIENMERAAVNFMVLHRSVSRALEMRNTTLLPNLSTIVAYRNDVPIMPLLLASQSQLHQLKVHMHPPQLEDLYRLLISYIPCYATQLKRLHLAKSGANWTPESQLILAPALAVLLGDLDLEEFECSWYHLDSPQAESLLKMPSLRVVTIFKSIPALDLVLHRHPLREEQHLQSFTVWTDDLGPAHLPNTIASLQPSRLEEFCVLPVGRTAVCDAAALKAFIRSVANSCSPAHFTCLRLEGWKGLVDFTTVPAFVDRATIRPLYAFSNLRHLMLAPHPFDLTDDEVKELAMAWPALEELSYEAAFTDAPFTPRTTLRALLWFATYCRKLYSLSFQFAGTADSFSPEELALAAQHTLGELSVGKSTITNPETVAVFLKAVFPKILLLLWTLGVDDNPNNRMWEQVEDMIQ